MARNEVLPWETKTAYYADDFYDYYSRRSVSFFYVKDLGYYRESKCIGDKNHTLKGGYLYVNIISSYFYCGACHGGNLQAAEITENNRNAYYRNRIRAIRFKSSRFLYIGDFSGLEKNGVNNYFVKGRIIPVLNDLKKQGDRQSCCLLFRRPVK